MSRARLVAAVIATVLATTVHAAGDERGEADPAPIANAGWQFALTLYPTDVRGGERYTSAIAAVDSGAWHVEARYNYESIGARSAFVGWSFTGGESVTWELRPLLGGAWGTTQAFVPALEASVAWRQLDFYIEAEYVRDHHASSESYTYAWSELGLRPVEWLRLGIAGQRTRVYGGERDIQRGPFVQLTWSALTLGAYWFNPGARDQVFVGSIGISF